MAMLRVRCNEDELKEWKGLAKLEGVTLSEKVRAWLNGGMEPRKKRSKKEEAIDPGGMTIEFVVEEPVPDFKEVVGKRPSELSSAGPVVESPKGSVKIGKVSRPVGELIVAGWREIGGVWYCARCVRVGNLDPQRQCVNCRPVE